MIKLHSVRHVCSQGCKPRAGCLHLPGILQTCITASCKPDNFIDDFGSEDVGGQNLRLQVTGLPFDPVYEQEIVASGQCRTKEFCGWGVELHFLFHL